LHGDADEDLLPIKGNPPSLINVPPGCAFHPRCRYAMLNGGPCDIEVPALLPLLKVNQPGHKVACHIPEQRRVEIYEEDIASVGVAQ
jgi:peptide/nickel transport system ATP-binding protein